MRYPGHIIHVQPDISVRQQFRLVGAIKGLEGTTFTHYACLNGHGYGCAAAVAAQTLGAIAVVIHQVEISGGVWFNEHEPIGTNTEFPVAQMFHLVNG
jgi:hypothetical protein